MTKENLKLSGPGLHYSCNMCCAWILESKAITGSQNKGHFCGTDCLEKWHAKQRENKQEKQIVTE